MKFFERDDRYNWVDDNNVLLGFEARCSCCEDFGYFYHTTADKPQETEKNINEAFDLAFYEFDPDFREFGNYDGNDSGGSFTARLRSNAGLPDLYLTIYNHHNGYYSHGFSFDKGETTLYDGYL